MSAQRKIAAIAEKLTLLDTSHLTSMLLVNSVKNSPCFSTKDSFCGDVLQWVV